MEFSVYGCNAGCYNELDFILYEYNFEYNWYFNLILEDLELLKELRNLGALNERYKLLIVDNDELIEFYQDNYLTTKEDYCKINTKLEMFSEIVFNEGDYFYLIIELD